ncbi:MAG: hypothetical protein FJX72_06635, partial [Armatimonadetes bacterium]|nr:hypothetical protein [Armatimonadota bacterium]
SAPGLEADVLSTAAADQLFTCAERMLEVTETAAPGTLRAFHTDSWEIGADVAGVQPNWTDDFREQFRKRRGYDILTYLPALTGRIATDRETTNRFLWDVRATIADLIAGFYGRLQQRAHARGCLVNPESGYGTYPHPHIDGLQVFGRADIPMAEFWHHNDIMSRSASFADALRNAASGARIYGRRVVQAEALTFAPLGGPPTAPWRYRKTLNRAYVDGLNQAVIHKIVHQPFEFKPGLEDYGILGRHYTWWPMADGLLGYMGRCQTMLQQGLFVADACYYVGEGGSTYVCGKEYLDPPLHAGRDFDGINAEVLSTRLAVRNGRLTLPGGLSYRVLVLPAGKSWTVRPVVLERILHLVRAGATVLGHRPRRAPGLTDRARQDARVRSLADRLWGREVSPRGIRRVGKGRVVWGLSPEALFRHDGLPPDFEVTFDRHRASLAGASWIWHPDDGTNAPACERLFRSTLLVPAGRRVARASAILTADNAFTLWVDGRPVAMGDDWAQTVSVALTGALRQGANAVEIRAKNTVEGPAGLIASFSAVLDDASSVTLATGPDWRASTDGTAWTTARVVAQYGAGPWGRPDSSPDIRHIHRQTADGTDVYFVANMGDVPVDAALRFRVTGRRPEYWDPLTGRTRDLTDWRVEQGRTVVPFRFEGAEGGFFVFRRAARPSSVQRPNSPTEAPLLELAGPWIVRFDPAWGGPARVEFAVSVSITAVQPGWRTRARGVRGSRRLDRSPRGRDTALLGDRHLRTPVRRTAGGSCDGDIHQPGSGPRGGPRSCQRARHRPCMVRPVACRGPEGPAPPQRQSAGGRRGQSLGQPTHQGRAAPTRSATDARDLHQAAHGPAACIRPAGPGAIVGGHRCPKPVGSRAALYAKRPTPYRPYHTTCASVQCVGGVVLPRFSLMYGSSSYFSAIGPPARAAAVRSMSHGGTTSPGAQPARSYFQVPPWGRHGFR